MKLKVMLGVLALTLAPSLAAAMCSSQHEQAMSCSEGATWDAESHSCVPVVSS